MTQYLLSVHLDDAPAGPEPSAADVTAMYAAVDRFNDELRTAGAWVFAGGLHDPSTATVVRAHDGDVTVTDGPYAEAKEQLGGFWVIEAPDLDAALEWARGGSVACQGPVEVRPFQDEPQPGD